MEEDRDARFASAPPEAVRYRSVSEFLSEQVAARNGPDVRGVRVGTFRTEAGARTDAGYVVHVKLAPGLAPRRAWKIIARVYETIDQDLGDVRDRVSVLREYDG